MRENRKSGLMRGSNWNGNSRPLFSTLLVKTLLYAEGIPWYLEHLRKMSLRSSDLFSLWTAPGSTDGDAIVHFTGPNVVDLEQIIGFPLRGLLADEAKITSGVVSALAGLDNDSRCNREIAVAHCLIARVCLLAS